MKVREVLTELVVQALKRLCEGRSLAVSGRKSDILERLARSYRGNLSDLVQDLRRKDLLNIASKHSDTVDFPRGLHAMPVSELREVCLSVFEGRYSDSEGVAKVGLETSPIEERQSIELDREKATVALYVTGPQSHVPSTDEFVNENSLQRMAADADSVTVFSAYYVEDVLGDIGKACRGEVRFLLNGLGGKRLADQKRDLLKLQTHLQEQSREVEIRLAFAKGLFHTKLYLFSQGSDTVAWVGSANATKAGLNGRNEEILVKLAPAPDSVLNYVCSAWKRAMPVQCVQQTVTSLVDFFRTGVLYYKPYTTLPMTLNPFRDLMEKLPHSEKQRITPFESAFANPEGGIGAFNLNLVFNDRVRMDDHLGDLPVRGGSVQLRRFAIETCYGYWVAEPFQSKVETMLCRASEGQQHRLEAMRDWMKRKREQQTIVTAYTSYLQAVLETLNAQGVQWRKHARPELFEDTTAVERHVASLLTVLDAESRLYRHCQAYVPSEIPEIWEDELARMAFVDSYFESLANAWSARRRHGSAKRILNSLSLSKGSSKDIQDALEKALEDKYWYKKNFAPD